MREHLEKIKQRIATMRKGGMELSPAIETIILKEAELAYKAGTYDVLEKYKELYDSLGFF